MLKSLLYSIINAVTGWIEKRRVTEMNHIQTRLNQIQWQSSMKNHTHEADLAAGYNLGHFNTMQ
jgi:hypothetical protein